MLVAESIGLNDPNVPREYFERLFASLERDSEGIQALRSRFEYPKVASRFRMITNETESALITSFGTSEQQDSVGHTFEELRRGGPNLRKGPSQPGQQSRVSA